MYTVYMLSYVPLYSYSYYSRRSALRVSSVPR